MSVYIRHWYFQLFQTPLSVCTKSSHCFTRAFVAGEWGRGWGGGVGIVSFRILGGANPVSAVPKYDFFYHFGHYSLDAAIDSQKLIL